MSWLTRTAASHCIRPASLEPSLKAHCCFSALLCVAAATCTLICLPIRFPSFCDCNDSWIARPRSNRRRSEPEPEQGAQNRAGRRERATREYRNSTQLVHVCFAVPLFACRPNSSLRASILVPCGATLCSSATNRGAHSCRSMWPCTNASRADRYDCEGPQPRGHAAATSQRTLEPDHTTHLT